MKKYEEKVKELENKLEILESENEDILKIAEEGIKITKKTLIEIRNAVIKKPFKSNLDEIKFFKTYKPQIYSKVIYYVTLFNIESKRPRSSNKSITKYLNNYIDKLQIYFKTLSRKVCKLKITGLNFS
ncbi:RteC domain-containing protein [Polaribacter batillariae]|uniref:RteC domain-containing protein n=1 Tax=Polaribacter batillariae TaxID=2808900 RepID=A0ABX7SXN6_9FLAO|nr:RteC domain-containing protein [Polaribacter batillariae]QTD38966.1 RteC domain-containing protein [Polaribacter batillariae]